MVVRDQPLLSLIHPYRLLSIECSSLYGELSGERAETLVRRVNELFLKCPFYGARQMVGPCAAEDGR